MKPSMFRLGGWPRAAVLPLGFGLAYLVLQEVGLRHAFPPFEVTAFWPAAGLAVAVLGRCTKRSWPALITMMVFVTIAGNVVHGNSWWVSAGFAAANVVEGVLGGWLLSRAEQAGTVLSMRWVLRGLLPAAAISAAIGAAMDAGVAVAPDVMVAGFAGSWWTWFSAEALGIMAVVPAVCAIYAGPPRWAGSWVRVGEAATLIAVQAAVLRLVFDQSGVLGPMKWPYLLLPGVFWSILRFGAPATAVLSAALTAAVVWGTASGGGPFAASATMGARMLGAQGFCLVIFVSSLLIAKVIEELEASKKMSRHQSSAMSLAVVGISYVGPDGCYREVNPAYAGALGRTPAEMNGQSWVATVHPDDLPALMVAYQHMLDTGTVTAEARAMRADGTTFYKEITMITDRAQDGTLLGHHCFMRDITERRSLTKHVDTLFQLSPELLCVLADGKFVRVNPAWQATLGYAPSEILGRRAMDFVHPDDVELTRAEGAKVLGGTESLAFENRYRCADGSYRWLRWNSTSDADGSLVYGIAHDVTDTKHTEHALTDSRDEALEMSRMKSQFLATMSHEIRTPMNGVIGLTHLLGETSLDDTQRRYVEGVRTAGDALLTVINDILDFSKIEAGKFVLDQVDFRLPELLDDVAVFTRQSAENKGLALHTDIDSRLPAIVRGDPGRLRQILLNLIGNAVKFTHNGSVTLRAYPVSGAQNTDICVEVTDTGIGMDAAGINRLFQAFQQADSSTTRNYGGTGLGLAISRQLVEAMGGAVTVDSTVGEGTTFRVTAPLPTIANSTTITAAADPTRLQVLIVDDNATNLITLAGQVQEWGMHATTAPDAEEALELLRVAARNTRRYDVAIIDMHMPTMNGLELADAIAGHAAIPNLPVILMTSGEAITADQARKASVGATITKPASASTLFDALTTVTTPTNDESSDTNRGTVLLVEDNEINQIVATGILTQLGYTIHIANDGIEALEMAAQQPYQAILMDCQMPRMDGYAATARLREHAATARTPIIALTANVLQEERERCLAAGMDDYLPKPIRAHDLDATLRRWTSTTGPNNTDASTDTNQTRSPISDRLHELLGGYTPVETAFIQKLVNSFISRAPGMVTDLANAITDGDAAAITYRAHALKGAASNLGAQALTDIAAAIEDIARTGQTTDISHHHIRTGAALDQTIMELTDAVATLTRNQSLNR